MRPLRASRDAPFPPLAARFDAFLFHLDDVGVTGDRVSAEVPGVVDALRRAGKRTVLLGPEGAPELDRVVGRLASNRSVTEVADDLPTALGRLGQPPRRVLAVGRSLETHVGSAARPGLEVAVVLGDGSGPAALLEHDPLPIAVLADLRGILRPAPCVGVRPARRSDAAAVRRLLRDGGLQGEGPPEEALVAEDGGIWATASVALKGDTAHLHSVAVAPEARGTGLGSLVVAGAARHAVSRGASEVTLVTEDAEGFFRRLGFRSIRRDRLPGWVVERSRACSRTAVAMRRLLAAGAAADRSP